MRPTFLPAVLVATVVHAACFLSTEPVERLELSLSLSTTQVHADTGVVVRLAATNHAWLPVHLKTTGGCVLGYYLIPPTGSDPKLPEACNSVLVELVVAPGEAIVREFTLRAISRWSGNEVIKWPVGRYQIVGYLLGEDGHVVRETEPQSFDLACRDPSWTEC